MKVHFLDPRRDLDRAQDLWMALQSRCPHSFFASWGWMATWLKQLPDTVKVSLVYGVCGSELEFCFHLAEGRSAERGLFYKNRAYLNSTGNPQLDSLTIEYNGILCGEDSTSCRGLFARPEFRHIEEFHLPGTQDNDVKWLFDDSFVVTRHSSNRSYFVNLADIRAEGGSYLDRLSPNRRGQIRKSIRDVEKLGDLELKEAKNPTEALEMLDQLIVYHQQEWESRGEPGAFASDFFRGFHRDLIATRFDDGEIQMLEARAGDVPIGYLYNFVYKNNVLFYQSGFNYAATAKCRPGLISHYLAVLHNLDGGNTKYDFLAGEAQYKKSLSTDFEELYWSVVSRRNIKTRLEMTLRRLKRHLA